MNEGTFIELIVSDDLRRELLDFLAGPERSADVLSTLALIGVVAQKSQATPDQLREAIRLLEAENRTEADEVLSELLFHPDIPENLLIRLAQEGKFIGALGHRGGPRRLLEILAERYCYPEAITTLALKYYGAKDAPAKSFRDFLRRYNDVDMLDYNLRRATDLDSQKRAIVREVFGEDHSPTPTGRKRRRRRRR